MQKFVAVSFEGLYLFLRLCLFVSHDIFLAFTNNLSRDWRLHQLSRLLSLRLSFYILSSESSLLAFVIHHFIGIVIDILFLANLFRMIDNLVILKIKFRHTHFYIIRLFHCLFHISFYFILQKSIYWMFEKLIPFNTFLWI